MRDARKRKVNWKTDLFAIAYDSNFWEECIVGTGDVSIASGELKLDCPANNDVAALVTKQPYNFRNCRISVNKVDVAADAVARSGIVLSKTKVTTSNPESENDILCVCLDQVNDKFLVTSNVDGAGVKTLYNANWTDGDGQLQIDILPDGYYTVYEDTTAKIVGSLPFTETATNEIFEHYLYLYAVGTAALPGSGQHDNFTLDYDYSPTYEVSGTGVRKYAEARHTPVIGRLMDVAGTADLFETDHDIEATPTQRIVLSRDVTRFQLEEVRYYMDATNAVTSRLHLYDAAKADDVESRLHMCFDSAAALADDAVYIATKNELMSSGAAVQTNATTLPVIMDLEVPGQVWFNQDWSGAPGDTKGWIYLAGREVE